MSARVPLRVSVVVMTVDRHDALGRCLESLACQSLPHDAFEVVVVDGSVVPAHVTVSAFRDRLRLVHHVGPNLGVAGNRNTGVGLAHAPVIAFLDDDCIAERTWLVELTTAVETCPDCLVGGRVVNAVPGSAVAAAGQVITEAVDAFFNPADRTPRFVPGLNLAFARARYLELGGCDPGFGRLAAEDRDLVDRWRAAGGRVAVRPRARVRHEHRTTIVGFVRQHLNYGRGAWRYHSLRRRRRSGRMCDDIRLHLSLRRHVGPPLMRVSPRMRVRVLPLLATWQLANLVGFASQGLLETAQRLGSR